MKKLNLLLLLSLCVLCSCSLENDDKQEEIYIAFATVENPNAAARFFLVLDDGTKLYTAETPDLANPDQGYPKDGSRILTNYNVLKPASSNNIRLINLANVPIDKISEENTTKRNDRYRLDMLYPGGKDYLNVLISHNFSSSLIDKHDILLVQKDLQEAHFDLIYSNGGDSGANFSMSPICFDLSSLKETFPDSVTLVINTYETSAETPKTYTMKYKFKN